MDDNGDDDSSDVVAVVEADKGWKSAPAVIQVLVDRCCRRIPALPSLLTLHCGCGLVKSDDKGRVESVVEALRPMQLFCLEMNRKGRLRIRDMASRWKVIDCS